MANEIKERRSNKSKKCENGRDKYENKILKNFCNIGSHMLYLKFTFKTHSTIYQKYSSFVDFFPDLL